MTLREEVILQMLRKGQYDGPVGKPFLDTNGHTIEHRIECGVPCTYQRKPNLILSALARREIYIPVKIAEYTTDADKLMFLRQNGYKINEINIRWYSNNYRIGTRRSNGNSVTRPKLRNRKGTCSYPKTEEELELLSRLESGELDGPVGNVCLDNGHGSTVWYEIKNGIPIQMKIGPGGKFFNNEENERWSSEPRIDYRWRTDDSKLFFLRRYGYRMNDPSVRAYSAKYRTKFKS